MKECTFCRKELNENARKCQYCGEFQNWKRHLHNVNITFAIIIAILTLLTAKPLVEFFKEKRADIKVSILSGSHSNIEFLIANIGNRPAAVTQIEIRSKDPNKKLSITYYLANHLGNTLLEPGQATVLTGKNGGIIPGFIPHEIRIGAMNNKDCNLVVDYVQLNGNKESLHYPFSCFRLSSSAQKK